MKDNENIKCNVENCKYINENCSYCTLKSIQVSCECDPCDCEEKCDTICDSFKEK